MTENLLEVHDVLQQHAQEMIGLFKTFFLKEKIQLQDIIEQLQEDFKNVHLDLGKSQMKNTALHRIVNELKNQILSPTSLEGHYATT